MSRSNKNIKHKNKRVKSKKNMRGGFAPDVMQHLLDNGFQQDQIDELSALNVSIDTINQAIEYFNNNFNAHRIIFDIAKNLHNNLPALNNIGLQGNTNQEQPAPAPPAENNDNSQNSEQGPLLNLSDLQVPEGHGDEDAIPQDAIPQDVNDNHNLDMNQSIDLSGKTSLADESMNNSINNSINTSMNTTNASMNAGRRMRRHTKKRNLKSEHKKSHRRLRGGAMYGTGYGANCNDPNYSIYNTNLTKLFPYRPTNNN